MSDNKGLENTKYKLIKNEDKLILTDKKTLKSRVLEIDDIDYVVDDNQRLRDPNVIENYFRLKDEPYEPKMMTKTADYVKEQKEAEKLYSPMKYEDLIDEFIKKYNITKMEIEKFSQVPDESTIKKLYGRTEEEKKTMINDFKILKKKLTENKNLGADIFTYLKSYFSNYSYNTALMDLYDKMSFDVYIKDKSFYKDKEDYEKIKNEDIKSLQDLFDKGINYFGGINLKFLNNLLNKYLDIALKCHEGNEEYFVYDSNHLRNAMSDKYVNDLNLMVEEKDKIDKKTTKEEKDEIRKSHVENVNAQIGNTEEKDSSNIKGYLSIQNDIIAELYKRTDSFKKMSPLDKNEQYDEIIDFIYNLALNGLKYFDTNFKIQILINEINKYEDKTIPYKIKALFWTSKNKKNKISLASKPQEYTSGEHKSLTQKTTGCDYKGILRNFYNNVLKPILDIVLKDVEMANGILNNKALGWTDKTLTRIEKITDVLREYGYGRINPALLKVMNRTASGWTNNQSEGWTDETLTRMKKINDSLREYI